MFLRNFDNMMLVYAGATFGSTTTGTTAITYPYGSTSTYYGSNYTTLFTDQQVNIKATSGALTACYPTQASGSGYIRPAGALNAQTICLGDGVNPVTYDDFQLAGTVLNSSFTLQSQSQSTSIDSVTGALTRTITLTLYNNTSLSKTISEWGVWTYAGSANSYQPTWTSFNNNSASYMITFREVLDEPVTIPAYATARVVLTATYPRPNRT